MELDFTGLDKLREATAEKPHATTAHSGISESGQGGSTFEKENPPEGNTTPQSGMGSLQLEADGRRSTLERAGEVYRAYQRNIATAGQLQTEILKGVRAGENIYSLFLKACKAVAVTTDNGVFYNQIERDIPAIYGAGLLEAEPLQIELQDVQKRLERLLEAEQRETEPDVKERIQAAIRAHKQKALDIQERI